MKDLSSYKKRLEAIENRLEERMEIVVRALAMMEAGKYGLCEVCSLPIEEKRLEADPAAPTCIMHMKTNSSMIEDEEEEEAGDMN